MAYCSSAAPQLLHRCPCPPAQGRDKLRAVGHVNKNADRRGQIDSRTLRCRSHEKDPEPFDRAFQESLATELGVKAIYEDDLEDAEDWDDILEDTEDPWMREPAGLYFAGELVEMPEVPPAPNSDAGTDSPAPPAASPAAEAGAAAAGAGPTAPGGYGAAIPRCTLGQAVSHVERGDGVLLAVDDAGAEVHPSCKVIPLADLDVDAAAPFMDRRVFVVPAGGHAEAMHAMQACIRMQSVLGHPDVTLVDTPAA